MNNASRYIPAAKYNIYPADHKYAGLKDYSAETYIEFIAVCTDINSSKQYGFMRGAMIDGFTASAVVQFHGKITDSARERAAQLWTKYYSLAPETAFVRMIDIIWATIKRAQAKAGHRN